MTEIYAWCPQCQLANETHVTKVTVINGSVRMELECGHEIREYFKVT